MIDSAAIGDEKEQVQAILQQYPENFMGLGRLKNYEVKFHVDPDVKPVQDAARPTPYTT